MSQSGQEQSPARDQPKSSQQHISNDGERSVRGPRKSHRFLTFVRIPLGDVESDSLGKIDEAEASVGGFKG